MDPALHPFSFKDDPELLHIAPLKTVVQDAGRSSNEGKSKQLDVQVRNLSKISRGERSRGRTDAGKAEAGIIGDQPPGHVQAPAVDVLSQQNLHGQHCVSAASCDSAGRSRESRYHSNVPGTLSQADHLRRHGNGMSSSEDGVESRERRPRMEHRQISLINRTIKDHMGKPRKTRVILDD
jgi:mRNA N6-methyladenine demethylase